MIAIRGCDEEVIDELLTIMVEKGVDINIEAPNGTAIHCALEYTYDKLLILEELLKLKPNMNTRDNEGLTPLLKLGKKFSFRSYGKEEDLNYNRESYKYKLVEKFLELGADIYTENSDMNIQLFLDTEVLEFSLKYLKLFLDYGYNVYDINSNLIDAMVRKESFEWTTIMLQSGYDINTRRGKYKWSFLFSSVANSCSEIFVEFLLKNGADANLATAERETPLSRAVILYNLDLIKLLLKYGADPNIKQKYSGHSAFMKAIFYEDSESAKILYEFGGNLYDKYDNQTVLDWILESKNLSISVWGREIIDNKSRGNTFQNNIKRMPLGGNNFKIFVPTRPSVGSVYNKTPQLLQACIANQPNDKIIQLLLENGKNPNETSLFEQTPLKSLIGKSYKGMILLLKYGANPNLKGRKLNTTSPLIYAIFFEDLISCKILYEFGANIEEIYENKTALEWILESEKTNLSQWGRELLAKKNLREKTFETSDKIMDTDTSEELSEDFLPLRFFSKREEGTLLSECEKKTVNIAAIERLLLEGENPNVTNIFHGPPLKSMIGQSYDGIELLLKYDADPNLKGRGMRKESAFMEAILFEQTRIAKLLYEHGGNIYDVYNGKTALEWMFEASDSDMIAWGKELKAKLEL